MRDVLLAIRAFAARDPERAAITGAAGSLTYRQLDRAITRLRAALAGSPDRVGLLMARSGAAIAADLALASLGRTIVPLPGFFSIDQWRHMIENADIGAVVTTAALSRRLAGLPVPVIAVDRLACCAGTPPAEEAGTSRRIIYTSGTTGRPKGVMLDESALAASLTGLEKAVSATAGDIHLSVLPFSLLLEQLAGVLLPLKVGAQLHLSTSPAQFPKDAARIGPTTSILTPDLLAGWVTYLSATGQRAPASLRFVAVGGAPVGTALAEAAWTVGIPVHEGYGQSECCSVVAVNRPGARRPATVGQPLDGIDVTIEDDEIVVRGPTVMRGYLGGTAPRGVWRTGDLGRWDGDGHLVVLGRKDDVVVTQAGRNVHPEWIEPMLLADPNVRRAAVVPGRWGVKAVLTVDQGTAADWLRRARTLTAAAPPYARPAEVALLSPTDARTLALFTPDGRPRRRRIARYLAICQ